MCAMKSAMAVLIISVACALHGAGGFSVSVTPLVRIDAGNAAQFTNTAWRAAAWRNERVHATFVIRGASGAEGFTARVEPETARDAAVFGAGTVQVRWVRETLASASYRYPWVWVDIPEHKVGDILDPSQPFALTDRAFRALWVTVKTPPDVAPGLYRASLAVKDAASAEVRCGLAIEVLPMTLPPRRKMYLDIWQTPWTIARYYGVKPFSPEHYARMEPIFRELAAAGQKAITATITDYPWNIRTNIDTPRSMVRYVKRRDGSFVADFTTLDEYVAFAKRCGIGPQIHCYAIVKFQKHRDYWYHDEATGKEAHVDCDPGTPEYEAYWGPLLRQLEAHARGKGWVGDIYVALDELPPREVALTAALVKKYAPSLKFQMAGDGAREEVRAVAQVPDGGGRESRRIRRRADRQLLPVSPLRLRFARVPRGGRAPTGTRAHHHLLHLLHPREAEQLPDESACRAALAGIVRRRQGTGRLSQVDEPPVDVERRSARGRELQAGVGAGRVFPHLSRTAPLAPLGDDGGRFREL